METIIQVGGNPDKLETRLLVKSIEAKTFEGPNGEPMQAFEVNFVGMLDAPNVALLMGMVDGAQVNVEIFQQRGEK